MNNKILNLLTLILMMFTSFLVIMTGNRQYQTEKVVSQFNLSSNSTRSVFRIRKMFHKAAAENVSKC